MLPTNLVIFFSIFKNYFECSFVLRKVNLVFCLVILLCARSFKQRIHVQGKPVVCQSIKLCDSISGSPAIVLGRSIKCIRINHLSCPQNHTKKIFAFAVFIDPSVNDWCRFRSRPSLVIMLSVVGHCRWSQVSGRVMPWT